MSLLDEKLQWVKAAFDEWGLDDAERAILLGDQSDDPEAVEKRCDAIYEIKCDLAMIDVFRSHAQLSPKDKLAWEAELLRTRNDAFPFQGQSPLEFAEVQGIPALAATMRGPYG